jgi:hypothetical protein
VSSRNGEQCSNCIYFESWGEEFHPTDNMEIEIGTCQRHAPAPALHYTRQHFLRAGWPVVDEDDWCGEHKPDRVTIKGNQ